MALWLASNSFSLGILNTTGGNTMNELCEIFNLAKLFKSANSSGNFVKWLWDKFNSVNKIYEWIKYS